jgi:hypothetical protein
MTSRRTALSAAVFVIAFVVGLLLVNNPDTNSPASTFTRYYENSGNRVHLVVAAALLSLAALAWMVVVTGLRERIGDGVPARLAAMSAAATAALLGVCGTLVAVIPAAMTFASAPAPGADVARYVPIAGYLGLTFFAMPAAALTVTCISLAALRTATLPPWLAYAGFAVSLLLLASVEFFPMLGLVLWVAATAVVLARRPLRIPLPAAA